MLHQHERHPGVGRQREKIRICFQATGGGPDSHNRKRGIFSDDSLAGISLAATPDLDLRGFISAPPGWKCGEIFDSISGGQF